MSNYLTKDEIKRWRSSLEKLTLEEYAAKLGKTINQEKETNDMVDKVMQNNSLVNMTVEEYTPKSETIRSITQKTITKEKELADKYNIRIASATSQVPQKQSKASGSTLIAQKKEVDNRKFVEKVCEDVTKEKKTVSDYTFKKNLTPRETMVFEHFLNNREQIIYAKDLAELLSLPRDYIYKYIKTLRNKLCEDCIFNADKGGFILK